MILKAILRKVENNMSPYKTKEGKKLIADVLLISAALSGNVKLIKKALDEGADIEATGRYGGTALSILASMGDLDAMKLLLIRGANVDSVDGENSSTPLINACWQGDANAVSLLLDYGANINLIKDGRTALMSAVEAESLGSDKRYSSSYVEVVKILLVRGADLSMMDNQGNTAKSLASDEVLELLNRFEERQRQTAALGRSENIEQILDDLNSDMKRGE